MKSQLIKYIKTGGSKRINGHYQLLSITVNMFSHFQFRDNANFNNNMH